MAIFGPHIINSSANVRGFLTLQDVSVTFTWVQSSRFRPKFAEFRFYRPGLVKAHTGLIFSGSFRFFLAQQTLYGPSIYSWKYNSS
jgi:hypothetical protein